jgi:hypothetical protein
MDDVELSPSVAFAAGGDFMLRGRPQDIALASRIALFSLHAHLSLKRAAERQKEIVHLFCAVMR